MSSFFMKTLKKGKKYILLNDPNSPSLRKGLFHNIQNLVYYSKIEELIPELDDYKFFTFLHLEKKALDEGYGSLKEYYNHLKENSEEIESLKKNLTLKGTHFFRGEGWDYLIDNCLPVFKDRSEVKIWCAGCSSGQEVYSLIMALSEFVPLSRMKVLATDYNDELVEKCRNGVYGNNYFKEIPEKYLKHLKEGTGRVEIREELKEVVTAGNLNLLTDDYPKGFDIIICRNVIKFFTGSVIPVVQEKLCESLESGGYLFVSNEDYIKTREMIKTPEEFGVRRLEKTSIYEKL